MIIYQLIHHVFRWQDFSAGTTMQNIGFYFLVALMLMIIIVQLKIGEQPRYRNAANKATVRFYQGIIHRCAISVLNLKRLWRVHKTGTH